MDRVRSNSRVRWILFGAAAVFASASARADEVYPRAAAAQTAQQLADAIEHAFVPLSPALPSVFGASAQVTLLDHLGGILRALGAFDLAERHWEQAQNLALAHADADRAAAINIQRCELALLSGDYTRTERLANELAQLAAREHLPAAQGSAEEFLGVVDRRHGEFDAAVAHEQRSLELQARFGDERNVARALSNLGTIARDRGDFAQALDLQLQSLAIRERIDDNLELTLRNLALIYRDLGDDATTRKYFTRAIEVATRHGDYSNYASTLGTYASYLVDAGEFAPALAAADEALAVARVIGNRPSAGFDLLDSGRALLGLKRLPEASARLRNALEMGRQLDQQEIVARSLVALSEAALDSGDRAQAHKLLDESYMSVRATQYKPVLAQAINYLIRRHEMLRAVLRAGKHGGIKLWKRFRHGGTNQFRCPASKNGRGETPTRATASSAPLVKTSILFSPLCPSGGIGRRSGLRLNLSPSGETLKVTPVKVGEGPGRKSELTPSQAPGSGEGVESRRRAPTAARLW